MRKTVRTVSLTLLLPLFFMFQTLLVPHVHFDHNGEIHFHSHLVAGDFGEASHHDNLDDDDHDDVAAFAKSDHRHTHDELHEGDSSLYFLTTSKIKFADSQLSAGLAPGLLPKHINLPPSFKAIILTAYRDHVFRFGHTIALQKHIICIRSVRIIS